MNNNTRDEWFEYVHSGDLNGIKYMLKKGIDVNIKDQFSGSTALILIPPTRIPIMKLLLKNGADVNSKDERDGYTLLIRASLYGQVDAVKLLLEYGANMDIQNNDGNTAIMLASEAGNNDVVKLLLKNGADVSIKNNEGEDILDFAKNKETRKVIEEELEKRGQELAIGYEKMTGESARPGTGPANLIRKFAGIQSPSGYSITKNYIRNSRKRKSNTNNNGNSKKRRRINGGSRVFMTNL